MQTIKQSNIQTDKQKAKAPHLSGLPFFMRACDLEMSLAALTAGIGRNEEWSFSTHIFQIFHNFT